MKASAKPYRNIYKLSRNSSEKRVWSQNLLRINILFLYSKVTWKIKVEGVGALLGTLF